MKELFVLDTLQLNGQSIYVTHCIRFEFWRFFFLNKYLPDNVCIHPQIWKTVVDLIKNIKINEHIVKTAVATDTATKIVATCKLKQLKF